MNKIEDYLFWKLAYFLIDNKEYRLLQSSKNQDELWFEKVENKQFPIIRLYRMDLDWSNWLKQNIELVGRNAEPIRRKLIRGEAKVLNIYFSAFSPVDDYEYLLQPVQVMKTKVTTKIITRESFGEEIEQLENIFQENIMFEKKEEYPLEEIELSKNRTLGKAVERIKEERSLFENGTPFFTYFFMGIQICAFLLLEFLGGSTNTATLIKYGAKFNPLILNGEWWRFLTPILLHIGFIHLFMNTLALYYLGPTVERIYGRLRFLFIYVFAGFVGSVASFLFSTSLSAGASGAIFGCFGALLYFGITFPSLFFRTMGFNILIVIAINLSLGFTIPGIDNAGHIGGLIGGFLAAGMVHFPKKKKWLHQLIILFMSVGSVSLLLFYGYTHSEKITDAQSVLVLSQVYIEDEEYNKAYEVLHKAASSQKQSSELFFQLSYVEIKLEDFESAEEHLKKTIELDSNFHQAYFNLALIYFDKGQYQSALQYATIAAEIAPSQKEYEEFVERIPQ